MASQTILATVWGEARGLFAKNGNAATLTRLHAVLAKLAAAAESRGLADRLRRRDAPQVGTPDQAPYETLKDTVDLVTAGQWRGAALPQRAALWEISAMAVPRLDKSLPKAADWILEADATGGGDFVLGDGSDGRLFRLFESAMPADLGELPFVSQLTGSGLPQPAEKNPYSQRAWAIGIVSVLLFVAGGALAEWSGRSVGAARLSLMASAPAQQYELLAAAASLCEKDMLDAPEGRQKEICGKLLIQGKAPMLDADTKRLLWAKQDEAASVLDTAKACVDEPAKDGCNTLWRAALAADQNRSWRTSVFSWLHKGSAWLTGAGPEDGSTSILVPFVMLVVGVAGLIVALGLGTKRSGTGVWIDTRNRVSLARAQVTLWTAVALAGYAALAMFNVGYAETWGLAKMVSSNAFPTIPYSIAAALGIAGLSPMISSLILPFRDKAGKDLAVETLAGGADPRTRGTAFFSAESGGLDKRASPQLASLADVFMGEEKVNADTVDISRLQNVIITFTLVLSFFALLAGMISSIDATTLLKGNGEVFKSLPELGATFTSLLFVSHATYLVCKASGKDGPGVVQTQGAAPQ